MNQELENAIAASTESDKPLEVETQESRMEKMQAKHVDFIKHLSALADLYEVNVLLAVNYKNTDTTGVEYVGTPSMVIKLGLTKAIELNQ